MKFRSLFSTKALLIAAFLCTGALVHRHFTILHLHESSSSGLQTPNGNNNQPAHPEGVVVRMSPPESEHGGAPAEGAAAGAEGKEEPVTQPDLARNVAANGEHEGREEASPNESARKEDAGNNKHAQGHDGGGGGGGGAAGDEKDPKRAASPEEGEQKDSGKIPQPLRPCPPHGNEGGHCRCPSNKAPLTPGKHRLAVIVPFRDGCASGNQGGGRSKNLAEFVPLMHTFLAKQNIDFSVILVDQVKRGAFNRGLLFNIGFLIANSSYDYIVLHDVDLVPENPELSYAFSDAPVPTHMCVTNSRTNYEPAYGGMVGGVLLMRSEQFLALNGFSNSYWNWGQEDDDMYNRIRGILGEVIRPAAHVGKYRALDHARVMGLDETPRFKEQRKGLFDMIAAANQGKAAATAQAMKNGLRQIKYRVLEYGCDSSYQHYLVDYLNPDKPMEAC